MCLLKYLASIFQCIYQQSFPNAKKHIYERSTLSHRNYIDHRVAVGCIRVQCRRLDPCINRISSYRAGAGYYQTSVTGLRSVPGGLKGWVSNGPQAGQRSTGLFFIQETGPLRQLVSPETGSLRQLIFYITGPFDYESIKISFSFAQRCHPDHPGDQLSDPVLGGGCDRAFVIRYYILDDVVPDLSQAGELGMS